MVPIVAGLLMGAAMGGGIAALQGKDILQGALMGGVGGALGGAFMPGVAGAAVGEGVGTAAGTATGEALASTAGALGNVSGTELVNQGILNTAGNLTQSGAAQFMGSSGGFQAFPGVTDGVTGAISGQIPVPVPPTPPAPGISDMFSGGIGDILSKNKYALAGGALGGMMAPGEEPPGPEQGDIREFEYSRGEINPLFGQPGQTYYTGGGYKAGAVTPVEDYNKAGGGIIALAEGGQTDRYTRPVRTVDPAVAAYNAQLMERANQQYNVNLRPGPNQVPGSVGYVAPPTPTTPTATTGQVGGITFDRATGTFSGELNPLDGKSKRARDYSEDDYADLDVRYQRQTYDDGGGAANGGLMRAYAGGGGISTLGSYSDGGQLLKGPGDGVEDKIPARIGGRQPARLANNEFVIPARIVSEIGNGSTDAGAKRLYQMMDRVQNARKKTIGKGKIAVDSKAHQMLPA